MRSHAPAFTLLLTILAVALSACRTPPAGTCAIDSDCGEDQRCCSGTCRNIRADVENCGNCGAVCPSQNGAASCESGLCRIVCTSGRGNCDNDIQNGCETDLAVSRENCGTCGNGCTAQNAAAMCSAASCRMTTCNAGFADCNQTPADGCEVNVQDDANHCGACNVACALPNATSRCGGGMCQVNACAPSFENCNSDAQDGCEVDTRSDPAHCGGCGQLCAGGHTCIEGACQSTSFLGFSGQTDFNSPPVPALWRMNASTGEFETLTATGAAPEARIGGIVVWDAPADRLVVTGGLTASLTADLAIHTLEFGSVPPAWSNVTPQGSQPQWRGLGCTVHDPDGRAVYMMGGITPEQTQYSDLWKLDLATLTWTMLHANLAPNAPAPAFSACAFDSKTGKLVVYGALDFFTGTDSDALWIYDTRAASPTWMSVPVASPWPSPRGGATFFAPGDGTVVLFGGRHTDSGFQLVYPRDLWTLTLEPTPQWALTIPDGTLGTPRGRWGHSQAISNGKGYLFGGELTDAAGTQTAYDDVWTYDFASKSWTNVVPPSSPTAPNAPVNVGFVAQ